jgi:hypothetical protein
MKTRYFSDQRVHYFFRYIFTLKYSTCYFIYTINFRYVNMVDKLIFGLSYILYSNLLELTVNVIIKTCRCNFKQLTKNGK